MKQPAPTRYTLDSIIKDLQMKWEETNVAQDAHQITMLKTVASIHAGEEVPHLTRELEGVRQLELQGSLDALHEAIKAVQFVASLHP